MQIRIPRPWDLPERLVTPEHLAMDRRAALASLGLLGAGTLLAPGARAQSATAAPPLPEHKRNEAYQAGRDITPERTATTYNNFYEFGTDKGVHQVAARMPVRPWTVKVDGMVEEAKEFGIDDLLRDMPLEERVYRLRCVEAWSMVIPWTGFPLSALLAKVRPLGSAKYVRFETAADRSTMPGLRQSWFPWPYVEGCTIEEAGHELSFMVVGAYGKPLPQQNGAPLRIHQPWKYGFKAGKSLVRITLTDQRPKTFWEQLQSSEYGFWANINPEVPHPRWSQAHERVVGTSDRIPTQLFNGYADQVASLYTGLLRERLWA